jgi:hypothetical protein
MAGAILKDKMKSMRQEFVVSFKAFTALKIQVQVF